MHPAGAFKVTETAALTAHLRAHPLAQLSAAPDGVLRAAHAPVLVREVDGALVVDFHLSRGNALTPFLADGFPGLIVSLGPAAYISPDWYVAEDQVPTWNYLSVEVEGPVRGLDEAGLIALLDDLSAQEEARLAPKPPWTRGKMSDGVFERMLRGIIGARMTVERIEGVAKLGQNKPDADRIAAAEALGDHPIARLMRD